MTGTRRIAAGYLGCAAALTMLQLHWLWNTLPSADGLAYFDVADQIGRIPYGEALPLHWSPLYPLYVLVARAVGTPALDAELGVTARADAVLLFALVCVVVVAIADLARVCWPGERARPGAWLSYAAGTTLFLAFAIFRVGLRMPDPLVAIVSVVVLWLWCRALAAGLPLRMAGLAGLTSGLAFLARANMMHWSALVAAIACVIGPQIPIRRRLAAFAIFAIGFAVVAAPHTYALSRARGTLAWGESGRLTLAVAYGAAWPAAQNGVSAWPPRIAGGDVRLLTDRHPVSFPGFYDPGAEYDDAVIQFSAADLVTTPMRSAALCLVGNGSPAFALLWPLLWATFPVAVFGVLRSRRAPDVADRPAQVRGRFALLLMSAGAAGFAMHLVTFCNGYYLPPYFILLVMGLGLAMLSGGEPAVASFRHRAAHAVGIGFVVAATILTLRYSRTSEVRGREHGLGEAHAMASALRALPTAPDGFRRIAVAGPWLGLYGVRLAHAQVSADVPEPELLRDPFRRTRALGALRGHGIVGLLAPTLTVAGVPGLDSRTIGAGAWSLIDLHAPYLADDADSGS